LDASGGVGPAKLLAESDRNLKDDYPSNLERSDGIIVSLT